MAIVFIPTFVALLEAKEKESGCELTRYEVESRRDEIMLPLLNYRQKLPDT